MKNLKNLTIASTLCVSACITAPTLTNAMMKSGKTPALSTNFMSRQDYISLTGTGKKTPGPFVQSRIRIFGDNGTSNSNTSGANLPSTPPKKQLRFGNSSSSSSSETSNIPDKSPLNSNFKSKIDYKKFTGTGKKTPGPFVQSRISMFGDNGTSNSNTSGANLPLTSPKKQLRFGNSSSSSSSETSNISHKSPLNSNFKNKIDYINFTGTGKKTPGPFVQSKIRMLGDKNNSDKTTPKPIPTQTPNTSDASTQTNPQVSKSKVSELKKIFEN